jgi:hypothetical protein
MAGELTPSLFLHDVPGWKHYLAVRNTTETWLQQAESAGILLDR